MLYAREEGIVLTLYIAFSQGSYLTATLISADYRLMVSFSLIQVIDSTRMRIVEWRNTMIIHLPICMHVQKSFLTREGTLAMAYASIYN